jgi:hypothetical protein|tara:strand:+ start:238 stop:501 length:264 start_codon:yes stop_codon:yes gene_type:complete
MAITKEIVEDKIEVVGEFKKIHVRTATVIKEDGVELSRSFNRHVVSPNSDSSNESADVKAMVAQFHTDEVKASYAKFLEDQKKLLEG